MAILMVSYNGGVPKMVRSLVMMLLVVCFLLPGGSPVAAETDEARVKAAFLLNFALFVEWPAEAFASPADPLTICVLGRNTFGDALDALATRKVRNRKVQVRQINEPEEIGRCQVLFVSSSEKRRMGAILSQVKGRGVLTVSDIDRFAHSGGMIGLVPVNDKIRFEINQKSAREAQLKVSSNLLKLARDIID